MIQELVSSDPVVLDGLAFWVKVLKKLLRPGGFLNSRVHPNAVEDRQGLLFRNGIDTSINEVCHGQALIDHDRQYCDSLN